MQLSMYRSRASCEELPEGDQEFSDRVTHMLNHPPKGHYVQDVHITVINQHDKIWHQAYIVYGDIPQ